MAIAGMQDRLTKKLVQDLCLQQLPCEGITQFYKKLLSLDLQKFLHHAHLLAI